MSDVSVLYECLFVHVYKRQDFVVCLFKKRKILCFFSFQMFGFPTDLFGIPNNNNNNSRRMNSNSLVTQPQSLFGNALMIPSPFNSLMSHFGMNSSPFMMMQNGNQNSIAPMHSFTSTTVMSYNGTDGRPKVYQETTSRNRGPGGIEETRQAIRDTERGINKVISIRINLG